MPVRFAIGFGRRRVPIPKTGFLKQPTDEKLTFKIQSRQGILALAIARGFSLLRDLPSEVVAGIRPFPTGNGLFPASGAIEKSIVEQISRLCTDAFADFCAVYLRSAGPNAVAFAAKNETLVEILRNQPFDKAFEERALSAGVSTIVTERLAVNDCTIGRMVLGISSEDALTPSARRSIAVLSSILSTAVDQAQHLEHHYQISKQLQWAMLPANLASVEGASFDAAYLPASGGADAGGDWYDAFDIGNGTIAISIGDVTAHGLEAALAMSQIRSAIRAAAPSHESPSSLLNYIDNFVVAQSIGMATAIVGYYDPKSNVLRYACAGHPNPIMVSTSRRPLFLPGGGLLLGLGMNPASQDWTVTLAPGSTCFFYTDGLLEYSHDVIAGEKELLQAIERVSRRNEPTAKALHDEIFNGTVENADDCATLALHHMPSVDIHHVVLWYTASPLSAALAREALRSFFDQWPMSEDKRFEILAATGEAIANAIEHGEHGPSSTFGVSVSLDDDFLTVEVENSGHWRPFVSQEERGRGVPIMRACSQSMEISSTNERTRVTLVFDR